MIKTIDDLTVYTVGGSVRDEIMGLTPHDFDYVVIGATIEDMLRLGFKPVGNDFPVFLHPQTHAEYALARSEKKTSIGYKGFVFYTSPEISLHEDLMRRDLTINAIAKDKMGYYIDPFNGIEDIKTKQLRHVSDAFIEDPLRVLRVARFSAQLNFDIAPPTIKLMKQIVMSHELLALSNERIWQETHKALMTNNIIKYFEVLYTIGAIPQILTACTILINNQSCYDKLDYLNQKMKDKNLTLELRFALLCYILSTQQSDIDEFINQSCMNKKAIKLAKLLILCYPQIHQLHLLSRDDIYNLVQQIDIQRNPERYQKLIELIHLIACSFNDTITRSNLEVLKKILFKISKLNINKIIQENNTDFILHIKLARYKIIDENILLFSES